MNPFINNREKRRKNAAGRLCVYNEILKKEKRIRIEDLEKHKALGYSEKISNPNKKRPCTIEEVIYPSIKEASVALGITIKCMNKRLSSNYIKWANWNRGI